MWQRLERSRLTSGIVAWAIVGAQKWRSGLTAKESAFIQLGTAVCAAPVGIRGQREASGCLQKARCSQEQGGYMCMVEEGPGQGAQSLVLGKPGWLAGGQRAGREVGGGPGEGYNEGRWWRASLLGLGLGRPRWWL